MCGICGILSLEQKPLDVDLLKAMNAALAHRGPDGEGYYHHGSIGLAMRRLAIIDLQTGQQPIANENRTVYVVMNGEIYNYLALRQQLQQKGHHLQTKTDTECLVHLYEEYGDQLLKHLRGMFAFALWDEEQQRLLIARDRLGKKPLYYAQHNGFLYFSSELPSLCAALKKVRFPFRISLPAIDLYLALQYIPDPYTPYEDIYKLPAAHTLTWQKSSTGGTLPVKTERYWELSFEPKWEATQEELAEELRYKVREAVKLRLISDVPLGAHLSGGFDSSIVVALMAEMSDQPVKTFSVGFREEAYSELPYARAVADRYATDHQEFILEYGDVPETLHLLVQHLGEPFADPSMIPLYHLSRLTREHVVVALNGDGGDDVLAGYPRYYYDKLAKHYGRLPSLFTHKLIPWMVNLLPDSANQPVGKSLVNGLKRLRNLPLIDERASIIRWGSYFSLPLRAKLWQPQIWQEFSARSTLGLAEWLLCQRFDKAPASTFLDRTLYTDLTTYLPGDLLVKADRMTMINSLEGRSPLLDHEFVEWASRLPNQYKVGEDIQPFAQHGKVLLKQAFASLLPPLVRRRGKQGFGIPVNAWMRNVWADWAKEVLTSNATLMGEWFSPAAVINLLQEHHSGREDHGKRLWALLVLSLWLNK